jgi:predicted Zn-dependent protease
LATWCSSSPGPLNARNADEGRSFFSKPGGGTKIGMKVVDERVTLLSDPLDPDAYGNTFDGDGLPPRAKMTWIENGVVKNLATIASGRRSRGRSRRRFGPAHCA